jgi:hypothetical protein
LDVLRRLGDLMLSGCDWLKLRLALSLIGIPANIRIAARSIDELRHVPHCKSRLRFGRDRRQLEQSAMRSSASGASGVGVGAALLASADSRRKQLLGW